MKKRKNGKRQKKNRKMLVLEIYFGEDLPDPGFFPDTEDLEESDDLVVLAADRSYSLYEATERGYRKLLKRMKENPYSVVFTTKVEDGRYVSEGGDEVYVLGGKVVDEREFIRQWLGKDCWFYELDPNEQDAIPSF